jgi:putative DNA primase/helicase
VLSPRKTLPTAQAYVGQFHTHGGGSRTIHAHGGRLFVWRANRYVEAEDGAIRNRLQPWLHNALRYNSAGQLVPFESNPATVESALETIRALVHLDQQQDVPFWIRGGGGESRPDPREMLVCRSGSLHIPTGRRIDATPDLFTYNALDFDYDPGAATPETWLSFLDELWPDDQASINLLQEWFGYCLTADTSQQKMLLLVGPRRSGKGTIGRVLTELVGRDNVAGPTTSSLAGVFGLQPLIGKSVAMVSDARFAGPGVQAVVERLLVLSGEDVVTVDRKHTDSVTPRLPCRFMFMANELPRLKDSAGALAGRFLVLELMQSFFGREDPSLTQRLLTERPGILLWALRGWVRLHERGRFETPQSAHEAESMLFDLASPVSVFVRDRCDRGDAAARVYLDDLYAAWKEWCEAEGRRATTRQSFGRELAAAIPGCRPRRNHDGGRFYEGLRLKTGEATF